MAALRRSSTRRARPPEWRIAYFSLPVNALVASKSRDGSFQSRTRCADARETRDGGCRGGEPYFRVAIVALDAFFTESLTSSSFEPYPVSLVI